MLYFFSNFALVMEKILRVHNVNDYARYIGAPVLHPLVSVIHYDELEHCRHSLNNYDVYGLFIGDEELEDLSYGQLQYDLHRHALMCVAPGQIGGKAGVAEIHFRRFNGSLQNCRRVGLKKVYNARSFQNRHPIFDRDSVPADFISNISIINHLACSCCHCNHEPSECIKILYSR